VPDLIFEIAHFLSTALEDDVLLRQLCEGFSLELLEVLLGHDPRNMFSTHGTAGPDALTESPDLLGLHDLFLPLLDFVLLFLLECFKSVGGTDGLCILHILVVAPGMESDDVPLDVVHDVGVVDAGEVPGGFESGHCDALGVESLVYLALSRAQ